MQTKAQENQYFFVKWNKAILSLTTKAEAIKNKVPEIIVLVLWTIIHFVTSAYHERWFDEAVAWQIAKNASLHDLLFKVPHYEGHPFLWHLILRPFAKAGVPYSFSLTIVSFVFMFATICVVMFYTKLPRILRLVFPFTYFVVYQYGVVSRPYCMMALALMILAVLHKKRNEKPFRYVAMLFALCMTSAYGIVLAFGICLKWTLEILCEKKRNIHSLFFDKRMQCLFVLFVCVLGEVVNIMPAKDCFAAGVSLERTGVRNLVNSLIYMGFILPADALFSNFFNEISRLLFYGFSVYELVVGSIFGSCVLVFAFVQGKRKGTWGYLLLPHVLLAFFSSFVYFSTHHIGIWFLLFCFWVIITIDESEKNNKEPKISMFCKPIRECFSGVAIAIVVIISIYQGIASCVLDVRLPYTYGKELAEFIEENDLKKYKIMVGWTEELVDENDATGELKSVHPYQNEPADLVNAYLGYNAFYNYLDGDDRAYIPHKRYTLEEAREIADSWKEQGYPGVLVGFPNLDYVFGEKNLKSKYIPVKAIDNKTMWKGRCQFCYEVYVFVRVDLAKQLGMKQIKVPFMWSLQFEEVKDVE